MAYVQLRRSMRGVVSAFASEALAQPTAMQVVAAGHAIPYRNGWPSTWGMVSVVQALPVSRSAYVSRPASIRLMPTTVHRIASHVMAVNSSLDSGGGPGVNTVDQRWPSQCCAYRRPM